MDFKFHLLILFLIVVLTHETSTQAPVCALPVEKGPCRARFMRYAYNSASGQCEQFIYGGCNANANNFKSMSECEETCKNNAR